MRQSNAHAWVEAYLPEEGWRLFDPTPPAGRPQISSRGWGLLFSQAYDYLVFRWDRYVLTYGFYDQVDAFIRLRELFEGVWSLFGRGDREEDAAEEPSQVEQPKTTGQGAPQSVFEPQPLVSSG